MPGTALTYITQAFLNLNVFQPGSTIPAAQANDALARLNLMMGTWAQQLTPYVITFEVVPIVAGRGGPSTPYTWGPTGNIPSTKPSNQNGLVAAKYILDSAPSTPVEVPLAVLTDDMYAAIAIKNLSSPQPTAVYYSPTVPLGALFLWPVPLASVNRLGLYREQTFGPFADLSTTTYTFPDGYDEAIVYNLERRLAGPYGRDLPPDDATLARETFANIFRSNQRLSDLPNDFALSLGSHGRHGYNIETGNG